MTFGNNALHSIEASYPYDATLSEPEWVSPHHGRVTAESIQSNLTSGVQHLGSGTPNERVFLKVGPMPRWISDVIDSLNSILALEENWDSYGACSVSIETALATITLLCSVMGEKTPLPSIVPTPSGNIQLEWHEFGIDLEVEIIPDEGNLIWFEDERKELESYEGESLYSTQQQLLNFVGLVTQRAISKAPELE